MTIVMGNIFWLIAIFISYILLFVLVPFWLRGFKLSEKNVLDNLVSSFLYSNIIIILTVSLLSLIGILNRLSIITCLLLLAILYGFVFKRVQTIDMIKYIKQYFINVVDGYYHPKVLLRDFFIWFKLFIYKIFCKVNNPIGFICTLIIFGYAAYIRCYHAVVNMFYPTSDMYLHTEWIKYFMHNKPYIAGVYPFGFHSVVAAVSSVFNYNVVTVMRMFGPIIGMLTIFVLYYVLKRTIKSTFGVNVALMIYVVTNLFPYWASERQFTALPQEFGTIFLYLTGYFLYRYMKDKELKDLVSFSISVSLTILIHFFVTIYAFLICAAIFVACISYIINSEIKKTLFNLVIGVVCGLIVAIIPLGVGLIQGIEFNGSMEWALSFFMNTEGEVVTGTETVSVSIIDIYNRLVDKGFFDPSLDLSLLNINWLIPYLSSAFIGLISPIIKFKKRGRQWIYMAFSMYSLSILVLFVLSVLDIFAIMEYSRLYAFFIYSIPLVIVIPFDMLYQLLHEKGKMQKAVYTTLICVISISGICYIGINNRLMPLGRVWQSQHNGAMIAYYDIVNNFNKDEWIIVSSMSEYSLCLFEGFHYEAIDFIMELEDFNEVSEVILPAKDVFIFAVKRPNIYLDTELQYLNNMKVLPEFNINDAVISLENKYGAKKGVGMIQIYRNYDANRVLQAKIHSWAIEYKKNFPDEMNVFFEDDDIIVYRLKQNPYAFNNLAITYPGNRK